MSSVVTARHRWRLFARVEALVRGSENSLRRRAEAQLPGRVKQTSLWQDLCRAGSRFTAKPFGLPVGLLALVALLAFWGGSLPWSPAVLADLEAARRVLGLLWQTQATALALTVAAALFAFESLVRQRQSAGLRDYAVRTGLQQFLMLGVAGLLCLGTVLVWTPARPPPAAATAALGVAAAWFLTLPLFLRRSFTVVGPEWFRTKRLQDVNEAVHRHVELEATSLVGRAILAEQIEGVEAGPTASLGWAGRTLEVAGRLGELYDVHLGRLQLLLATSSGEIAILRHLGGRLADDAVLLATNTTAEPAFHKPVCTVVRQPPDDELARQITALHEEALEAIRVGSPSAAEEVATAYVELLLAWPRAWRQLNQTVEGGLLDAWGPFTVTPLDEVRVNLIFQLEQAVAAGLREHVFAITAIPRHVAREALDLQATDLVQKTNSMLLGFVSPGTEHTQELRKVAADQAQMHQVELCDFYVTQGLEQAATATTGQPDGLTKRGEAVGVVVCELANSAARRGFPTAV